jgi:hypothetical protein
MSKNSTAKIMREIDNFHKIIAKDGIPAGGFRNRPAVNVNKPELDFSSRMLFACSPSSGKRNLLVSKSIMKSYRPNRHSMSNFDKVFNLNNLQSSGANRNDSFDQFSKEFQPNKKVSFMDKIPNRKKKF